MLYDTRILEANTALRIGEGESRVINLNKLSDSELSFLTNILNKNGLWGRMSGLSNTEKKKQLKNKRKGNAEFQSILVDVVNSTDMKEKIEQIVLGRAAFTTTSILFCSTNFSIFPSCTSIILAKFNSETPSLFQ